MLTASRERIPALLFTVFALCLPLPSATTAQVDGRIELSAQLIEETGHKLQLAGTWKFHPDDDLRWADPEADDSDWVSLQPLLAPDGLPASGWPGIGWFRLHVQVDSTLQQPLSLICKQFGASEVYLDGHLFHRFGHIDSSGRESATNIDLNPRLMVLTPASEHVLAVRHANTSNEYLHRVGGKSGFSLWLGELDYAVSRRTHEAGTHRMLQYLSMGVLFVFSLFFLMMFLFYPAIRRNLYIALFAGVIAILVFLDFQIEFAADLAEHTLIERLWRICVALTAVTGLLVCYAFLYVRLPRTFWIVGTVGLALGLTAAYRLDLLAYVYLYVLVVFVDIIRLLIVAVSRRRRVLLRVVGRHKEWVWTIFIGMVGCILLITYQILQNVGYVTAVAGFKYPYLFGILFFLVPVSAAYLFFDFAKMHRKQQLMNLQLEKRVERRTRDLEVAVEAADDANKAKSRFLANVSHEIRTPMNAILGYAQVLQRSQELAPDHRAAVETIHSSGNHLLNLLDDVLELSKIESGRLELHPWDFDLTFLLDSVESMIVSRCTEKGLGWSLEWSETKPLWVHGDESKLAQVLINLLSNAAKYTREGEIALEALRIDRDRYRFTVKDTGPGITERDQPMLYVAFEQGPAGIDRGGAGLGLAIAHRYVELMGGELSLDSTVGEGSSFAFSVSLPAGQEGEVRGTGKTWTGVKNLAPGFSVDALVVDDDPQSSAILTHLLDEIGAEVKSVDSGRWHWRILAERSQTSSSWTSTCRKWTAVRRCDISALSLTGPGSRWLPFRLRCSTLSAEKPWQPGLTRLLASPSASSKSTPVWLSFSKSSTPMSKPKTPRKRRLSTGAASSCPPSLPNDSARPLPIAG